MRGPIVHIVHHIDTEGPLKEPFEEIFKRLETTLGIACAFSRTEESFRSLQNGIHPDIKDPAVSKTIQTLLTPHLMQTWGSWNEIEAMIQVILSPEYRRQMTDSFGGEWIYNWHLMDHVGFQTNERGRDLGYAAIFNRYENFMKRYYSGKDAFHWHFHPISFFKEAHIAATSYDNSYPDLHQILCHRLIDKGWFPRVNRPGFHTQRPDSAWFLEQWIPFDASNQSIKEESLHQDASYGRFGDWKGAPDTWEVYRPDHYDWRRPGFSNRVISRVLNMKTRFRNINKQEIESAFRLAKEMQSPVYLGITNHDFRDMAIEIDEFRGMLAKVVPHYPEISFKFSEAVEAFRSVLGYSAKECEQNKLNCKMELIENRLCIEVVNGEPFGPQPYLAIKTKNGQYFHDNFDFGSFKKNYYYTFDRYTLELDQIEIIAVASNDCYGNTWLSRKEL